MGELSAGRTALHLELRNLARQVPPGEVERVAAAIEGLEPGDWAHASRCLQDLGHQLLFRKTVRALVETWQTHAPEMAAVAVAAAFRAVAFVEAQVRQEFQQELVWTGPDVPRVRPRRTPAALKEVIDGARHRLLLVSYMVQSVPDVRAALVAAAERGVKVRIVIETEDLWAGRQDLASLMNLSAAVRERAEILVWPMANRISSTGYPGLLHAKCAVADGQAMLVTSANLTAQAHAANIELGVLMRGGELPARVEEIFQGYVDRKVLVALTDGGASGAVIDISAEPHAGMAHVVPVLEFDSSGGSRVLGYTDARDPSASSGSFVCRLRGDAMERLAPDGAWALFRPAPAPSDLLNRTVTVLFACTESYADGLPAGVHLRDAQMKSWTDIDGGACGIRLTLRARADKPGVTTVSRRIGAIDQHGLVLLGQFTRLLAL